MASRPPPTKLAKQNGIGNRIKRIMQSDDDVGKVAAASTHLVAVALEEFLTEVVNGAAAVAISRESKNLAPAHVKAHVMMEPTLDFCRSVVQRAPDLTEEGADGVKPKAKKERKPKDPTESKKKAPAAKKRKVKNESEEEEEEEWRTEDETDEDDMVEDGLGGDVPAKQEAQGDGEADIKVDLGDLGDLDVDGLVGEDELNEDDVGGGDGEDNYDEF